MGFRVWGLAVGLGFRGLGLRTLFKAPILSHFSDVCAVKKWSIKGFQLLRDVGPREPNAPQLRNIVTLNHRGLDIP